MTEVPRSGLPHSALFGARHPAAFLKAPDGQTAAGDAEAAELLADLEAEADEDVDVDE